MNLETESSFMLQSDTSLANIEVAHVSILWNFLTLSLSNEPRMILCPFGAAVEVNGIQTAGSSHRAPSSGRSSSRP